MNKTTFKAKFEEVTIKDMLKTLTAYSITLLLKCSGQNARDYRPKSNEKPRCLKQCR